MVCRTRGLTQFLRKKRIEKKITQLQAATALGHSTAQYVSNFERGLCEPSIETVLKLCEYYGISKRELYDLMLELYESALKKKIFSSGQDKKVKGKKGLEL
jgi:transcriptional regulator with XRE-family HTH domain